MPLERARMTRRHLFESYRTKTKVDETFVMSSKTDDDLEGSNSKEKRKQRFEPRNQMYQFMHNISSFSFRGFDNQKQIQNHNTFIHYFETHYPAG